MTGVKEEKSGKAVQTSTDDARALGRRPIEVLTESFADCRRSERYAAETRRDLKPRFRARQIVLEGQSRGN